jgi:hypothetical protein
MEISQTEPTFMSAVAFTKTLTLNDNLTAVFAGAVSASNLSGTNTGDLDIATSKQAPTTDETIGANLSAVPSIEVTPSHQERNYH